MSFKRRTLTCTVIAACLVACNPSDEQADHLLEAGPETVAFGHYDPRKPAVLTVRSGDVVEVTTLIAAPPKRLRRLGVPPDQIQAELDTIYEYTEDRGPGGHVLTGPIYVQGAEPGDVLEVRVLDVSLATDYGYNHCRGYLEELCDESARGRLIRLDRDAHQAEIAPGVVVPLRVFFGSMGVAPSPEVGRVSSKPPHRHGGNMDNRELTAGSTLYLPVFVPGALFSIGDGHAAQGDGEVNGTGLETSLRGRIQLLVRKGEAIEWPRAETPDHYILMGFDRDLHVATEIAIREAVGFLQQAGDLTSAQAYSVVSMAGNLRITQVVDENVGVHVLIDKSFLDPE